jgi:hypothetical protein
MPNNTIAAIGLSLGIMCGQRAPRAESVANLAPISTVVGDFEPIVQEAKIQSETVVPYYDTTYYDTNRKIRRALALGDKILKVRTGSAEHSDFLSSWKMALVAQADRSRSMHKL